MKRTLRLILLVDSVQTYFSLKYETKKKSKIFLFYCWYEPEQRKGEDKLKS